MYNLASFATVSKVGAGNLFQINIQEYSLHGFRMKITLNIDETLVCRLRGEVARRGTTMSALIEAGIRRVLTTHTPSNSQPDSLPATADLEERRVQSRHLQP